MGSIVRPSALGGNPDHRQALVLVVALGGPADNQDVAGDRGVRAEDLLAAQDEAAVDPLGRGGEGADVGARFGLGHRDRLDVAACDAAEDVRLLLVGAEALRGTGDDQGGRVAADRRQAARGLLHEQAGVDHSAARAADLLRDRHPEPPELAHLPVELVVVGPAVAVGEPLALLLGAALALGEVANRGDEIGLGVGQGEVHEADTLAALPKRTEIDMQITRNSIETTPGPADWFTGNVFIDAVAAPSGQYRVQASSVHFTPGARTAWHTHPNGQTIFVTEGMGLCQRRGEPVEVIGPGDRVFFEPEEEHWHGATPDRFMTHIAIVDVDDEGNAATWGDHVTDTEYGAAP